MVALNSSILKISNNITFPFAVVWVDRDIVTRKCGWITQKGKNEKKNNRLSKEIGTTDKHIPLERKDGVICEL